MKTGTQKNNITEWGTTEEAFRLATIVLADTAPERGTFDFAYLFACPLDNERSAIERGAELFHEKRVSRVGVLGGGPYRGGGETGPVFYRGGDLWTEELLLRGVPHSAIMARHSCKEGQVCHTGTEAEHLVLFAKEKGFTDIVIVTAPFHMLRAFTNTVTQTMRHYPELRIWCRAGTPLPWNERVIASQDLVPGLRSAEILSREFMKLHRVYKNQYDLLPARDLLAYLTRREG